MVEHVWKRRSSARRKVFEIVACIFPDSRRSSVSVHGLAFASKDSEAEGALALSSYVDINKQLLAGAAAAGGTGQSPDALRWAATMLSVNAL